MLTESPSPSTGSHVAGFFCLEQIRVGRHPATSQLHCLIHSRELNVKLKELYAICSIFVDCLELPEEIFIPTTPQIKNFDPVVQVKLSWILLAISISILPLMFYLVFDLRTKEQVIDGYCLNNP